MNTRQARTLFTLLSTLYFSGMLQAQADPHTIQKADITTTYVTHAEGYNATFEATPAEDYVWSGGDHGISIALPYCATCPTTPVDQRNRRIWLFGDSQRSYIAAQSEPLPGWDAQGLKHGRGNPPAPGIAPGTGLADSIFGNTVALTYHPDNQPPARTTVDFDWVQDDPAIETQPGTAWLDLLLDPLDLPAMDATRLAMNGHLELGFDNQGITDFLVFWRNTLGGSLTKRTDLVPVYEYYNSVAKSSHYSRAKFVNGGLGFEYRGLAFFVLDKDAPQPPGTAMLYRHYNSDWGDHYLSTHPTAPSGFGYAQEEELGYVYTDTETVPEEEEANTTPLTIYFRILPEQEGSINVHHRYTIWPNDTGFTLYNWPLNGVVIGTDLVLSSSPTFFNVGDNKVNSEISTPFVSTYENVFTVIPNVDKPMSEWGKPAKAAWTTHPTQLPEKGYQDIRWGVGLAYEQDPSDLKWYAYIFGSRHTEDDLSFPVGALRLYLARVEASSGSDIFDNDWQFYADSQWFAKEHQAAPLVVQRYESGVSSPVGISFATPAITLARGPDNTWLMTMSGSAVPSPLIEIAQSTSLAGPWTVIADADLTQISDRESDYVDIVPDAPGIVSYYAIHAHDGLSSGSVQEGLMISFSRVIGCWLYSGEEEEDIPDTCLETNKNTPANLDNRSDIYQSGFVDIPWSALSASSEP